MLILREALRGYINSAPLIRSKNYRVTVADVYQQLHMHEAAGQVTLHYDPHLKAYSYVENTSGRAFSWYATFNESSWPDWLKDHAQALYLNTQSNLDHQQP